jgi:glutamate/aspartate transport system substrate-binding protein
MKKTLLVMAALAAVSAAQAQTTDTLKKIKDTGSITLGVRESSGALAYTLGDGKYVGFHTQMAEKIAADLQKQLGLSKLEVKFQPVTSQNRIPLVQNGTVDLECGSTTNNAARQKDVSFAVTTYVEEVRIAVKANSGITSIAQLAGKKVATTTGTTSVQTLRKHERAAGVNFEEVFGKDHADSFLLLESGRADAFVMDGQILAGNISKAKAPADFKIVGEVLSVEPIACMLRKDDPAFQKAVDDSIKAQIKDGSLAKLYDKWFMQPIPPANTKVGLPMSDATKAAWANPNSKPMEDYAKK